MAYLRRSSYTVPVTSSARRHTGESMPCLRAYRCIALRSGLPTSKPHLSAVTSTPERSLLPSCSTSLGKMKSRRPDGELTTKTWACAVLDHVFNLGTMHHPRLVLTILLLRVRRSTQSQNAKKSLPSISASRRLNTAEIRHSTRRHSITSGMPKPESFDNAAESITLHCSTNSPIQRGTESPKP